MGINKYLNIKNTMYIVIFQLKDAPSSVYGIYDKKEDAYNRRSELINEGNWLVSVKTVNKNESIDIEL